MNIDSFIKQSLIEARITKGFSKSVELYRSEVIKLQNLQDNQAKLVDKFKKSTPDVKERMKPELISMHRNVQAQTKVVQQAEYKFNRALEIEPVDLDERIAKKIKSGTYRAYKEIESLLSSGNWKLIGYKNGEYEFLKLGELAYSNGNNKLIKYHLGDTQTFMGGQSINEIEKNKEFINKYNEMRKLYNESNNTPMMSKSGKNIFVDTTFVQLSNKFGKLSHLGMGDFVVKTDKGNVEFERESKRIEGFSGRVHRLVGDATAIASLIKNMKPKVVKESVNEKNVPKKGTSDYHQHKIAVDTLKNPNKGLFMGGPSAKEAEQILMKKFGYSKNEIDKLKESVNERYTGNSGDKLTHKHDKNIEIELIEPTNKGWKVYQTDKGRKRKIAYFDKQDIVGNKALFESINEASRRATEFYGESKHGKALHSLLKGKWDSNKVEKYLDKLGGGNDVKYIRIMDFISGAVGLNIRKYNNINQQLPDLMKQLEVLYKDFLTESVTEGIWPKSKLSDRFQFLLAPALKKNFKGIFYVVGYDLYHNDKKIMVINPDKDSVTSIVNHVSRNRAIQKNESNITEGKYSNKSDAMNAFFKGKISGKELADIAKNDFNGAIATKGELTQFLKNSFMQDVMADQYGIPKSTLVKKVKELLPIVETNTTPNQTMFESVVDADGMQRAGVALPQTEEEPIEESTTEPKIITQLRDVMKSGYKKLKDPKSGRTMTVDSYSASAIVKVYDALNTVNKEKFSNAGLLGMQSMAFKLIK